MRRSSADGIELQWATLMNLVDQFNAVEALFWLLLGFVVAVKGADRLTGKWRWLLAATLLAFGLSDFLNCKAVPGGNRGGYFC